MQDCRLRIISGELDDLLSTLFPEAMVGKFVSLARSTRKRNFRRSKRESEAGARKNVGTDQTLDGSATAEILDSLESAILKLNPRYQQVLRLRMEWMSIAEIASIMELELGAAKVLVSRARNAFKKAYLMEA